MAATNWRQECYAQRFKTLQERFDEKVRCPETVESCSVWTGCCDKDGYGFLRVLGKNVKAHRLAYELFVGEIPEGMNVCHTCDNPRCVKVAHLWLGTNSENQIDAARKGRNHSQKITIECVMRIREAVLFGAKGSWLAQIYGLSSGYITNIVKKKKWAHVN